MRQSLAGAFARARRAGNDAEGMGDERWIAILDSSFQIGGNILARPKMVGGVERLGDCRHAFSPHPAAMASAMSLACVQIVFGHAQSPLLVEHFSGLASG